MTSAEKRRGWPLKFDYIRSPPEMASATMVVIGIIFFGVLFFIATFALGWLLVDLVSGDQRRAAEASKTALPVIAAAIGLPLLIWRLLILDRQTRISDEKTQIDRETHYTSIFSRSIDQLGQTREFKTSLATANGVKETAKTVPNIEVRLGGIHSLSRLAEESVRDREKIGNILRSYIRENSWSDRAGQLSDKPSRSLKMDWLWAYDISFDSSDTEVIERKNKWKNQTEAQYSRIKEWARNLPETRVDVNEAADALETHAVPLSIQVRPTLYECLFVGRLFNRLFLSQMQFKRCAFVRCTFDVQQVDDLNISDSHLFECVFAGTNSATKFANSYLGNIQFKNMDGGTIIFLSCDTASTHIYGPASSVNAQNTALYKFNFLGRNIKRGENELTSITLNIRGCLLFKSTIEDLKLSDASDIMVAANPETRLRNVDLSNVTKFYEDDLSALNVNPRTLHPKNKKRPTTWPAFDPSDEDDDIPF